MEIIDNYTKLPLGKYMDILAVSRDETLEELDKQVRILSILSGLSEEEVLHLPIGDYKEMVIASRFLEDADYTRHRIAKKYSIGGWDLIPVTDYRKIETCQYVDFQTFVADMENRMVELVSVLLVPKGHRYNEGYDILEVQKAIRDNMSVSDGVTLVAFFLTLCKRSIADLLNYSKREAKGIKDKAKREEMMRKVENLEILLSGNGDGSQV